jgi:hypothetical protein
MALHIVLPSDPGARRGAAQRAAAAWAEHLRRVLEDGVEPTLKRMPTHGAVL